MTTPIDLQAYDSGELRFMIATALKEIDRLRALSEGLCADKESNTIAFLAVREERDAAMADATKNENTLHIGRQINRACQVLPEGWRLVIDLELNSGTVALTNPDGDFVAFGDDFEGFAYEIGQAIDKAKEMKHG